MPMRDIQLRFRPLRQLDNWKMETANMLCWSTLSRLDRFRSWVLALCSVVLFGMAGPNCFGQLSESQRERLAVKLEQRASTLEAADLPASEEEFMLLQEAYAALTEYLDETTDEANQAAWLKYVGYDALAESVEEEQSLSTQVRLARQLYWRLARNLPGLERRPVTELRLRSRRFAQAATFRDRERTAERISSFLKEMAKLLRDSDAVMDAEQAGRLNRYLEFVEASGLAPDAVQQLRMEIGRPNIRFLISADTIADLVGRPVNQSGPSNECILGTRVISNTNINGYVTLQPVPSDGVAKLQLTLSGRFNSVGTGYNRKVRVYNQGFGDVWASRSLTFSDQGIQAGPVAASADLDSKINGISHPLRIVRRIAAKRAASQKSEANAIASQRLEDQLRDQFQQETDQQLSSGNKTERRKNLRLIGEVLARLDLMEPKRNWSSTSSHVVLTMTASSDQQVTTAVAPPSAIPSSGVTVQFHESALENVGTSLLAERPLSDKDFEQFAAGLLLLEFLKLQPEVTTAAVNGDEKQPAEKLEIDFAALRPLVFEARDGKIRIGIRGNQFRQGSRSLNRPLEITAVYKPGRTADGFFQLERESDIDVSLPGGRDAPIGFRAGLIRNLEERFADVFPQVIAPPPFSLDDFRGSSNANSSGQISTPQVSAARAKMMRLQNIVAENGWLSVHLQ